MLAKAAAACIPARSQAGGCNLLAASAQAVGARALPGEGCSGPQGTCWAGAFSCTVRRAPLGPVACWVADRSGVAGLTICVEREAFNFRIPRALMHGLDAPDPAP